MKIFYRSNSSLRKSVALAAVAALLNQNVAWAVCSDGTQFPAGGYVIGTPPVTTANNFSPFQFTGSTGSIFIPDSSTFENNDPAQPLTGGGHNWVFDQGSTLCKETDTGPAGAPATGWQIPANGSQVCVVLPILNAGVVVGFGTIPYQGAAITPTCNPALLSTVGVPNPANTYFNQLGCSISHGAANTPKTATTYLFVTGSNVAHSTLFQLPLGNVANPVVGGPAGKIVGGINAYTDIPDGRKLTNAAVSLDGRFAMASSIRQQQPVYACLNPLGDPGDPSQPINPAFIAPPAGTVKCMQIGNNALSVDLTTNFGPDNQPYFGGTSTTPNTVNSFNQTPGGTAANAWPQCIFNGVGNLTGTLAQKLATVFNAHSANHCGNAQANIGFMGTSVSQPQAMAAHGFYLYSSSSNGSVVQIKVTADPATGISRYASRTYVSGLSLITGVGVADDLQSLIAYSEGPFNESEFLTKLPLCEDF